MASEKITAMIDEIKALSVLELKELVDEICETFGVSAVAAAAPAAGGAQGSIKIEAGAAGKVFKVEASVGQAVKKGDTVLILEAMKMEIPQVAPEDGTVASINVNVGDPVEAGAVLATLN